MQTYLFFQAPSSLSEITNEHYRWSNTNFGICSYWKLDLHHNAVMYPQMIYGLFPEPFWKIDPNVIPGTIRNTYKYSEYSEEHSCTATRFLLISPMHKRRLL